MAANVKTAKKVSGATWMYEGRNLATGQMTKGEVVAKNEKEARERLMRKGVQVVSISKLKKTRSKAIKPADVTVFTRQLATMMKAGLPLLQAFEIVAKGHSNPSMTKLLMTIRQDIEQGSSLAGGFAKHPKYFDRLYVNLVGAGEQGGVLESLLDKLATYMEKTEMIKKKVKGALMYPTIVTAVAVALVMLMMMFVLPAFKQVYAGMGAQLPGLTQWLMDTSDYFVAHGFVIIAGIVVFVVAVKMFYKRSFSFQKRVDAFLLEAPIFGPIVKKSTIARWGRTLATLFTAGVPLVDALESVGGASGNIIYEQATNKIRQQVEQGASLTSCMLKSELFPNMFLQMASIGEESGSLDDMLDKASGYYEDEVDNAVNTLSSMMEPIIMLVLGSIIGVILIGMYLPLFNLGNAVG